MNRGREHLPGQQRSFVQASHSRTLSDREQRLPVAAALPRKGWAGPLRPGGRAGWTCPAEVLRSAKRFPQHFRKRPA